MTEGENSKQEEDGERRYDLEERTHVFAKRVRAFIKRLPRIDANVVDGRQLLRASGSVGANYIEANEALSRKDFICRIKICRKESKECRWWLRLLDTGGDTKLDATCAELVQESTELMSIFGAILRKSE
jgi:four helix bundle protein